MPTLQEMSRHDHQAIARGHTGTKQMPITFYEWKAEERLPAGFKGWGNMGFR
jgi:hypothetical protein